jgi:hypothetical protein
VCDPFRFEQRDAQAGAGELIRADRSSDAAADDDDINV